MRAVSPPLNFGKDNCFRTLRIQDVCAAPQPGQFTPDGCWLLISDETALRSGQVAKQIELPSEGFLAIHPMGVAYATDLLQL